MAGYLHSQDWLWRVHARIPIPQVLFKNLGAVGWAISLMFGERSLAAALKTLLRVAGSLLLRLGMWFSTRSKT